MACVVWVACEALPLRPGPEVHRRWKNRLVQSKLLRSPKKRKTLRKKPLKRIRKWRSLKMSTEVTNVTKRWQENGGDPFFTVTGMVD